MDIGTILGGAILAHAKVAIAAFAGGMVRMFLRPAKSFGQAALLISERDWLDFISYSGGLPMFVTRVTPDPEIHAAIIAAATVFEAQVAETVAAYHAAVAKHGFHPTERRIEQDIML